MKKFFGIAFRGLADAAFYALTLPIRVLFILYMICRILIWSRSDKEYRAELFKCAFDAMASTLSIEWHWVKTGNRDLVKNYVDGLIK